MTGFGKVAQTIFGDVALDAEGMGRPVGGEIRPDPVEGAGVCETNVNIFERISKQKDVKLFASHRPTGDPFHSIHIVERH